MSFFLDKSFRPSGVPRFVLKKYSPSSFTSLELLFRKLPRTHRLQRSQRLRSERWLEQRTFEFKHLRGVKSLRQRFLPNLSTVASTALKQLRAEKPARFPMASGLCGNSHPCTFRTGEADSFTCHMVHSAVRSSWYSGW